MFISCSKSFKKFKQEKIKRYKLWGAFKIASRVGKDDSNIDATGRTGSLKSALYISISLPGSEGVINNRLHIIVNVTHYYCSHYIEAG